MKKAHYLPILFLVSFFSFAQQYKVKVTSSEDNRAIKDAKLVTDLGVYCTNDEGILLAESNTPKVWVSAPTFVEKEINLSNQQTEIQLYPKYTDIQEVQINNINVLEIFQNTLKNYLDIYYSKPSLYQGVIKQKAYIGNNISNFMVADINVWSRYNLFNFSEAKNIDSFFQMNLNNIRYYKTTKTNPEYPFNNDVQLVPSNFVQKIFLNSEIAGILNDFKGIKMSSKLINNTAGIQKIDFNVEQNSKMDFSGFIIYNKNDNAIIYLEAIGKKYTPNPQAKKIN